NLKQIGLAIHNYHSVNNCFPPGTSASFNPLNINNGGNVCMAWNGWSAQALMLGYLEQNSIYNAANFMLDPMNDPQGFNTTAFYTNLNVLRAASDDSADTAQAQPPTPPLNNYYASTGTTMLSNAGTDAFSGQNMGVNNGNSIQTCNGGTGSTGLFYYATSYGI